MDIGRTKNPRFSWKHRYSCVGLGKVMGDDGHVETEMVVRNGHASAG